MAGSPPLPPDGFFPTRRNPEFQSDRFFGASHGVFPAFQAMDSIQCESEQQQPMLKRPRLTDETPSPHNGFPIPAMQPAAANPAQNSKNNPFFKTRPCRAFDNGHCVHGNGCLFAHGPGELRQPLPGWESAVPKEQPSNAVQSQRKKICRRYEREQECPYGDTCVFLHDSISQRMSRRPDAGLHSWEPGSSSNSSARLGCYSAADNSEAKTAFWKTKLCHKFEKYGHCPFGDKCQYAHGAAELQKIGGSTEVERSHVEVVAPSRTLQEPAKVQTIIEEEIVQEKKLLEWKGPKKLSLIYGDWIGDLQS